MLAAVRSSSGSFCLRHHPQLELRSRTEVAYKISNVSSVKCDKKGDMKCELMEQKRKHYKSKVKVAIDKQQKNYEIMMIDECSSNNITSSFPLGPAWQLEKFWFRKVCIRNVFSPNRKIFVRKMFCRLFFFSSFEANFYPIPPSTYNSLLSLWFLFVSLEHSNREKTEWVFSCPFSYYLNIPEL